MHYLLKYSGLLILKLVMVMLILHPEEKSLTVAVSPDSSLIINGKSNVNRFQCAYDISQFSDSLEIGFTSEKPLIYFSNAQLTLKNMSFNCGHKAINRDFHELLKTEQFPSINLELISAEGEPESNMINTKLNITISGISKIYDLMVEVDNTAKGILICGSLHIDINDFNLDPPKKLLGMIKVSNYINIDFNLGVKTSL
ncbi:YceI family protein [Winogradskyella alexanderae]|uniref:YceI family protein n=1 Tax=Winogradskyella alexanderae TaxID=2877123 RepID=A0ABS7XTF9_9FLAO|nr:YceI family protein [Winogradskyella alexanderae]MCA0132291.1 YceI family protein [Winogradskyella alexanderae]